MFKMFYTFDLKKRDVNEPIQTKMSSMKKVFFIISVLFFSLNGFTQIMHAGVWNNDDLYFDFNPDTILPQPPANGSHSLPLDLNGDNINDFIISTIFQDGSQWYWEKRITLKALNQNQIAYASVDSCMSNDVPAIFVYASYSPHEMVYNELIDENLNWTDSAIHLSFTDFKANYPTNAGYSCSRTSSFKTDTGYVAVRMLDANDTIYGWIKLSHVDFATGIVHEYACENKTANIKEDALLGSIVTYPNPTSDFIRIKKTSGNVVLENIKLYNTIGELMKTQNTINFDDQIDLSQFADGVYFLYLESKNGFTIKKVMVKKNP